MNKIRLFSTFLTMFFVLCFLPIGHSQTIPPIINYSGTLTDTGGTPVPDDNYDIEFKIYNVASGGVALWTEKWDSTTSQVTVVNGVFNVMLGNFTPIPESFFTDNPTAFLSIKVGTDSEMSPRQQITSVAYTFTAGNGIPRGGIIMWSGTIANIPTGWALCDGTNGTPDLRDRFVMGLGGTMPQTGGNFSVNVANHSHSGPNHNHSILQDGAHSHSFSGSTAVSPHRRDASTSGSTDFSDRDHTHTFSGNTGTANVTHAHGGVTGLSGNGQTGSAGAVTIETTPPYYKLAFIMKL